MPGEGGQPAPSPPFPSKVLPPGPSSYAPAAAGVRDWARGACVCVCVFHLEYFWNLVTLP